MPITMTRAQYQTKYGTAPQVQPTTQPSTEPIKMTRAQYQATYGSTPTAQPKSVSGFLGNVVKSGVNAVGGIADAVIHPKRTLETTAHLVNGLAGKLLPENQRNQQSEQMVNSVGNYYKDRYGKDLGKTLYEDPVGVALDAATVAGGTGAVLKGAGTASKLSGMTKAGNVVSKAGRAIDPINAASKVASPVFNRVGKVTSNASDFFGNKALKFKSSHIKAVEDATGMKPLEYARANKLPIAATESSVKQVQKIIDTVKNEYNSLVKQGKPVSRKEYAQALIDQADEIVSKSDNPSTRAVAAQLKKEAKFQKTNKKPMTDELLAGTKSSAFAHATKSQIGDPKMSGLEEQIGRAGVNEIERLRPGSKALGKKQRGLIEYKTQLEKQAYTGKGTQFFNILKPTGAGMLAGAGAGSFLPGVGNLAGAVVGGTAMAIANSPQFLSFASRSLQTASKGMPKPIINLFKKAVNAGKAGRMFTPTSQEGRLIESIQQSQQFPQSYEPSIAN